MALSLAESAQQPPVHGWTPDALPAMESAQPSELGSSHDSLPTMVLMRYGADLESPWSDKQLAKKKFLSRIALLQPAMARRLVLMKVHIKENGFALMFFFEHVADTFHSELLESVQIWVGNMGNVRILSEEEVARQVVRDVHLKRSKDAEEASLGNLDAMTSLLTKCVALQRKPDEGKITKQQRRTGQLAVRCVDRAQAQKEKNVNWKMVKASADSDSE